MQLNSITLDRAAIVMKVLANKETDDSNDTVESKVTAKEEPLPSFTKAFDALPAVVCEILEVPKDYTTGMTITRLAIRRTKQGTRSVIISFNKQLECRSEHLHPMSTPCIQVDKQADGESGAVQIEKKLANAITKAIHEAERYMGGDRSQKLLDFEAGSDGINALANKGRQAGEFAFGG